MVELAILIGIFSYLVFAVGLIGNLGSLSYLGIGFLMIILFLAAKKSPWEKIYSFWQEVKKERICLVLLGLLFAQVIVNLIGALGPELGFDALWYHLTIPKIYLQQERIFFIPGSLFYYSAMPKLSEMLYLVSLVFSSGGTLAKLIHFSFGIFSAIALYNLARRYLKQHESILTILIFYTTLIVGWQSITAYVDLARTFFEILALDLFLRWWGSDQTKKEAKVFLIESAVMLGLAISTKLLALASLPIFLILIFIKSKKILPVCFFLLATIIIPLPWFVFSFIHTGNPIFPIFSGILDQSHKIVSFNLFRFFGDLWTLFYRSADQISPIFLIFFPVVLLGMIKGKLASWLKIVAIYFFLSLIFWYFTPRTGGSRFILPYLPALSLLVVAVVFVQGKLLQKSLFLLAIFSAIVNIGYRTLANKKFLPVVFGRESKNEFLSRHLNFKRGDFLDLDNDLKKIIKEDELVLVYGSHNLFYADFPFVHSSFANPNLPVSYILVQNNVFPKEINLGKLVYHNQRSEIKLYFSKVSLNE